MKSPSSSTANSPISLRLLDLEEEVAMAIWNSGKHHAMTECHITI